MYIKLFKESNKLCALADKIIKTKNLVKESKFACGDQFLLIF